MSHPPTAEQQQAIDLFKTGRNLVIEAGAGTGKTSTLMFLAAATPRRGQYVAFNNAIVAEARTKFPGNVNCSTAHSLAVRSMRTDGFDERQRQGKRMRSVDLANRLGVNPLVVEAWDGERKLLSSTFLAGLVMRSVTRFCQTADLAPTWRHVPRVKGLDGMEKEGGPNNERVARHVEQAVRRAWADLTNEEGGLPFTKSTAFSVYLKLWQLSRPVIGADFILFDEAQDANPVMAAVVALQGDAQFRASHGMKPAQLVYVGDTQQQIYGFTGAVNAMATLEGNRTFLTQSFRFGPAIANVANHVLAQIKGAELRLTGFDKIQSVVAPVAEPNALLTRTNATAVTAVLNAQREGTKVHLVGGGEDVVRFAKAAKQLMDGMKTDHPDLACFDSWGEVQEYAAEDEQGGDLKLLVKLVDEFTVDTIIEALAPERQIREDDADLVVSTAHKAKGREWETVKIAGDFPEDRLARGDESAVDELRLLYVAVTRAKVELDVEDIPFLRDNVAPVAKPAEQPKRDRTARQPRRVSEHVGQVGDRLSLTVRCTNAKGMTTPHGYTHLTRFIAADGNVFKAFIDQELKAGATYEVEARVKAHGEFQDVKETTLNYVDAWEVTDESAKVA